MASGREGEVCGGAGRARATGKISRRVGVWGRRSACLLCLPSLAGARWPLSAPETQRGDFVCAVCDSLLQVSVCGCTVQTSLTVEEVRKY